MSPKRTTAGYLVIEIDWSKKYGIVINRSSETRSLREYNAFIALLWQLRENGQIDVLRAFADGRLSVGALKQAKRHKRLKSDEILVEIALDQRLWHHDAACPKRHDPAAEHSDACLGAVDRALPRMGKAAETRRRYYTSLAKLRRVGAAWLPADATVRHLTTLPWRELRARWTVSVRRRQLEGKSKGARAAGYRVETREASAADWNHLARAISAFLTVTLGDVHHPVRRRIVAAIEREQEIPRRPKIRSVFWDLVDAAPEHARPCYVVLGASGMRVGEYLGCDATCLRPDDHAIDAPDGKTGHKTYFVDPEYWPWVILGVPSPLRYGWLRKYFKRAAAAVGRPELHLHDLRHLFAQTAKHEGVHTTDTQAALGQRTPGIARDYEMEEVQSDVARAVGRGLSKRRKSS